MANQKEIRKRIASVKSTQKITRAMKMVAGARLNRAQARISALRPYAVQTGKVLHSVVGRALAAESSEGSGDSSGGGASASPLLARRTPKKVLLLVVTSDRGLCGAFNTNILRFAERKWREAEAEGKEVQIFTIGRKGRDYFKRQKAPLAHHFSGVWESLDLDTARKIARGVLSPFLKQEVDSITLIYNEFKSAMTQTVVAQPLFPLEGSKLLGEGAEGAEALAEAATEYVFEPDRETLLEVLVPMYIEITVLRALYESVASELGARMTAMDSATKNASDMIGALTLKYNRARQAAITTELMEIIGGAEALSG